MFRLVMFLGLVVGENMLLTLFLTLLMKKLALKKLQNS